MKIILAFSGGLDTSFCVPFLKEQEHEIITVTVNTGGFTEEEMKEIEKRAYELGSTKHYSINGEKEMYNDIISYLIKSNGFYESFYPNMCSDRYIIAKKCVEIFNENNAQAICHGSSGVGNDQVRFDVAIQCLAPRAKIITPIRDINLTRDAEINFLLKRGFSVSKEHKKYSINQNILGRTISGSEIDINKEPDESIFEWTKMVKNEDEYVELTFEKGLPVKINDERKNGEEILKFLNKYSGSFGIGRSIYMGNCIIGIKGRIAFESPGISTLSYAHRTLEQLVLTKKQMDFKNFIEKEWANLVFSGYYYDPLIDDMKSFLDKNQEKVSGKIKLKLTAGRILAVEVSSPYELKNSEITYAQSGAKTAKDSKGFINLWNFQQKLANFKRSE